MILPSCRIRHIDIRAIRLPISFLALTSAVPEFPREWLPVLEEVPSAAAFGQGMPLLLRFFVPHFLLYPKYPSCPSHLHLPELIDVPRGSLVVRPASAVRLFGRLVRLQLLVGVFFGGEHDTVEFAHSKWIPEILCFNRVRMIIMDSIGQRSELFES
jgi:hypothetical protein